MHAARGTGILRSLMLGTQRVRSSSRKTRGRPERPGVRKLFVRKTLLTPDSCSLGSCLIASGSRGEPRGRFTLLPDRTPLGAKAVSAAGGRRGQPESRVDEAGTRLSPPPLLSRSPLRPEPRCRPRRASRRRSCPTRRRGRRCSGAGVGNGIASLYSTASRIPFTTPVVSSPYLSPASRHGRRPPRRRVKTSQASRQDRCSAKDQVVPRSGRGDVPADTRVARDADPAGPGIQGQHPRAPERPLADAHARPADRPSPTTPSPNGHGIPVDCARGAAAGFRIEDRRGSTTCPGRRFSA
jgi:hypothetical protein